TLFGDVIVWNVILPGSQTQVVLPPSALDSLRQNYAGQTLYCELQAAAPPSSTTTSGPTTPST
ncbi:MAG TPA: hypothetical protein VH208_01710, partial [Myxococcaceae bacterium]|nr:hypothetical protein [Myxococcaceae bacterium]